jgi:DNA-binding beta-propeller fold protein YncE
VDNGRVTVYGDNFFPAASIGQGRGLITALSVYVDREGNVYVPQGPYYGESARISVYNAAFFPVRKIDLGDIPGAATENPKSLIIGDNGFIYLAFETGVRGLLVLDKDGQFSHWLKPMDLIFDQEAIGESREAKEQEEEGEATREEPEFDVSELVPELVPKTGEQVFAEEIEPGMGPVQVNDVQRDKEGNLYLLSTETSKVYIYNSAEEYLYNFGEKGGSTGKLSQPRQLVVDDKKKAIYIVDYNRHAILIYDLSGRFMHEFGGKGNLPGWFQYPRSIATNTKGQLLVADMFNNRVQVLDVQFEYKFPLFQVPFVFDQEGVLLPQPVQASRARFYAPGFGAGGQASATGDKEEIKALLDNDGDVI